MEARRDRAGLEGHLQTSSCAWTQSQTPQRAGRNQPPSGTEDYIVLSVSIINKPQIAPNP